MRYHKYGGIFSPARLTPAWSRDYAGRAASQNGGSTIIALQLAATVLYGAATNTRR
ncbi:hypothetical protein L873DRAFT_1811418 [Choiromyces venosus 120613-1]|uniref:Uncharacterized protein n=1 Tax=Choiromyces venosus 120613-1 TaxID=1336337 RepID=A0A3N4JDI0_9PEZI|nr:hypothetical protein L873DRAFT_1811418 [Choiromyces venosus 120613-1]